MLTAAEVARCLSHDAKEVRDHALRSLAMAGRSEIQADLPLATLERLGVSAFGDPTRIADLPPSPELLPKLFAAVAGPPSPVRAVAAAILQELPGNLLLSQRDAVRKLPAGNLRTRLDARLALAERSCEDNWTGLLAATDPAEIHDLILALLEQDAPVAPLVSGILGRNMPAPGELAAIELAGRIHLATAVNALADRLARPDAVVAKAAAVALGRIGTAGAATVLEQRCNLASANASFRLHVAHALSRFRIPSVEATLLRLLVEEDDPGALCALCTALADACTTSGFPRLRDVVSSGRCGDQTAALKQSVSALDLMLKSAPRSTSTPTHYAPSPSPPATTVPAPSAPSTGPIVSTFNPGEFSSVEVTDEAIPPADELPLMEIPDAPAPAPSAPGPTPQLRRDADQVGRNDLCPCGSGKKYKKCCGR